MKSDLKMANVPKRVVLHSNLHLLKKLLCWQECKFRLTLRPAQALLVCHLWSKPYYTAAVFTLRAPWELRCCSSPVEGTLRREYMIQIHINLWYCSVVPRLCSSRVDCFIGFSSHVHWTPVLNMVLCMNAVLLNFTNNSLSLSVFASLHFNCRYLYVDY